VNKHLLLEARQRGRDFSVAGTHRGSGKRFVVHADEKLTAFVELELATYSAALAAKGSQCGVKIRV